MLVYLEAVSPSTTGNEERITREHNMGATRVRAQVANVAKGMAAIRDKSCQTDADILILCDKADQMRAQTLCPANELLGLTMGFLST